MDGEREDDDDGTGTDDGTDDRHTTDGQKTTTGRQKERQSMTYLIVYPYL